MNILDNASERIYKTLGKVDSKFKKMGKEPFGIRKMTLAEQRRAYENLTPDELMRMIERYPIEDINAWLSKFEVNNGRL